MGGRVSASIKGAPVRVHCCARAGLTVGSPAQPDLSGLLGTAPFGNHSTGDFDDGFLRRKQRRNRTTFTLQQVGPSSSAEPSVYSPQGRPETFFPPDKPTGWLASSLSGFLQLFTGQALSLDRGR